MLSNTVHSTGTCMLEEEKPCCIWFRLSSIGGNNNNKKYITTKLMSFFILRNKCTDRDQLQKFKYSLSGDWPNFFLPYVDQNDVEIPYKTSLLNSQ